MIQTSGLDEMKTSILIMWQFCRVSDWCLSQACFWHPCDPCAWRGTTCFKLESHCHRDVHLICCKSKWQQRGRKGNEKITHKKRGWFSSWFSLVLLLVSSGCTESPAPRWFIHTCHFKFCTVSQHNHKSGRGDIRRWMGTWKDINPAAGLVSAPLCEQREPVWRMLLNSQKQARCWRHEDPALFLG